MIYDQSERGRRRGEETRTRGAKKRKREEGRGEERRLKYGAHIHKGCSAKILNDADKKCWTTGRAFSHFTNSKEAKCLFHIHSIHSARAFFQGNSTLRRFFSFMKCIESEKERMKWKERVLLFGIRSLSLWQGMFVLLVTWHIRSSWEERKSGRVSWIWRRKRNERKFESSEEKRGKWSIWHCNIWLSKRSKCSKNSADFCKNACFPLFFLELCDVEKSKSCITTNTLLDREAKRGDFHRITHQKLKQKQFLERIIVRMWNWWMNAIR